MFRSVTLEDAKARLDELIDHLGPGEEVVITQNDKPVATLIASRPPRKSRQPGSCKGMLSIVREDDEHLEHLKNYMP